MFDYEILKHEFLRKTLFKMTEKKILFDFFREFQDITLNSTKKIASIIIWLKNSYIRGYIYIIPSKLYNQWYISDCNHSSVSGCPYFGDRVLWIDFISRPGRDVLYGINKTINTVFFIYLIVKNILIELPKIICNPFVFSK